MKIRSDFKLRDIAGETVVIPTGEASMDFQGIMSLNESGKFLWDMLENDCNEEMLVKALLDTYEVDDETAKHDVSIFLEQLKAQNILQDSE
ncbi:MAG: PqqD family protein [Erysipelotrichaceae bacterium]|nr:PqqD family protein [Erysipelotrichaceae bacterium]